MADYSASAADCPLKQAERKLSSSARIDTRQRGDVSSSDSAISTGWSKIPAPLLDLTDGAVWTGGGRAPRRMRLKTARLKKCIAPSTSNTSPIFQLRTSIVVAISNG